MDEQVDQARADVLIAAVAARQHAVVSWHQLLDGGVGRGSIEHRVRIGQLHRMFRGVFAVGHPPLTREAWWMAAVLAHGPGAVLSHASAAALWELRPSSAWKVDVTIASRSGRAQRDRIRLHRCGSLTEDDVTTHRGIPVTTIARTLLDVAATLTPPSLARAIERSEILRRFDLKPTQQTLARHPNHPGARPLTRAIGLYREDELTRSGLEAIFLALCDAHALPRPRVNHMIEGEEVDFCWPQHRLVIETDGRATHLTHAAFERDRARDAKLTVAGYRVVRYTHHQIRDDPGGVAGIVRTLLARTTAAA